MDFKFSNKEKTDWVLCHIYIYAYHNSKIRMHKICPNIVLLFPIINLDVIHNYNHFACKIIFSKYLNMIQKIT